MIYIDYLSTTPVDQRVVDKIHHCTSDIYGNANSIDHVYGDEANKVVKQATQELAELINCLPKEIIFTSGATESINLAIQGSFPENKSDQKCRVAVLPVEHKAVLDTCTSLEKRGLIELVNLKVDSIGRLDLDYLEKVCKGGLSLLCAMAANNEIGNIYPIKEVGRIAQKFNIPFLCDATQAVGKIPVDFQNWGITMLALSAHKMYGPKGVGALIVKKGHKLKPILFGGGQQHGIRPGTLNVPGIVGLGEACRLRHLEMHEDEKVIAIKRDRLQSVLQAAIPELVINGDIENRLAGSLHISIPGIPNSAVIARVRDRLAISTGSACTSGTVGPSYVLQAIGLPDDVIGGSLRISLGKFTIDDEVEQAGRILIEATNQVKQVMTA